RAQFLGLTTETTRYEIVRAVCEGLAYTARQCLDIAGLQGSVVVCGGGVRSREWVGIIASVLGHPVSVVDEVDVGARGAVREALSRADRRQDDTAWIATRHQVQPEPCHVEFYDEQYRRFLD